MENAVEALKMAFAVMFFVMALSVTIYMFGEARTTADAVLASTDMTRFIEYQEAENEKRIVGLETVIPTLYKYYKENYTVIFKDESGFFKLYETQMTPAGYYNKYYDDDISKKICSFDLDEEDKRQEPWLANNEACKKNLDAFLSGGTFPFSDGTGRVYNYSGLFYGESFIQHFSKTKFIESIGEYVYNTDTVGGIIKERKKRVIIYTIIDS